MDHVRELLLRIEALPVGVGQTYLLECFDEPKTPHSSSEGRSYSRTR